MDEMDGLNRAHIIIFKVVSNNVLVNKRPLPPHDASYRKPCLAYCAMLSGLIMPMVSSLSVWLALPWL